MPGGEQLEHFIKQSCRRDVFQQAGHFPDGAARFGVDRQAKLGGQTHRAQHAHRILAVTCPRFADHAQRLCLEIADTMVVVDDVFACRVVIECVSGEVAAGGVFLLRAEDIVVQDPAVFVLFRVGVKFATEGGDLDHFLPEHRVHDLEAAADDA